MPPAPGAAVGTGGVASGRDSGMSTRPVRVLIADDEPQVCQVICDALSDEQVHCTAVASGREARQLLLSQSFDVLVCDMLMPEVGGRELLELIASRGLATRAVCITGVAQAGWGNTVLAAGAFAFFEKPFDVHQLAQSVLRAAAEGRGAEAAPLGESAQQHLRTSPELERDPLTGLLTFAAFREFLSSARRRCVRLGHVCAALVVDVDDFARVNVAHGYGMGDLALVEVSRRIRGVLGGRGVAARGGADEVLVLLPARGPEQAAEVAGRVCRVVAGEPITCGERAVEVTVSVGLAWSDAGFRMDPAGLIERARAAMRTARKLGGNGVVSYTEGMAEEPVARPTGSFGPSLSPVDRRLQSMLLESAGALVRAVEAKDPYTRRHSEHVAFYAEQLCRYGQLPEAMIESVRLAGLLHDIGKIAVPDSVLTKPARLSRQEYAVIRRHPEIGAAILENISLLKAEARLVRFHHESWDGSGYPTGLAGEAIPLGARILNIADSMDAMLMSRSYKPAYSVERMLDELARGGGSQFDPALARAAADWCRDHPDRLILPTGLDEAETA